MIVACYHPLPLSACMLHFDLVSILFGTSIPTSFNILVKMFLHLYTGELTTAPQILCDKSYRYAFCDDIDGCSDLRNEDSKSVNVTVPMTSLMDFRYTVTFMVYTNDICINTTTPLGE